MHMNLIIQLHQALGEEENRNTNQRIIQSNYWLSNKKKKRKTNIKMEVDAF